MPSLNYKLLIYSKIFDKKILIVFFSFIILIFLFESINFENSFLKYLSFFRFLIMLIGLILFLENTNKKENFLDIVYKTYTIFFIIIAIDVYIEYFPGSNILGFSSNYMGRIVSFTDDELIIGYIFSFLVLFSLIFIYRKIKNLYFFLIICVLIATSFFIGERSNFIKLSLLIFTFCFIHIFYLNKFKLKNLFIVIFVTIALFISFFEITKNTYVGKRSYYLI